MKRHLSHLFAALFLAGLMLCMAGPAARAEAPDTPRVEPPFWWTGMKDGSLQIMLYGKDLGKATVSLGKYKGVTLSQTQRVQSPNYLFLTVEVGAKAKAGTFDIVLTSEDGKKTTIPYELRQRDSSPKAQGFSPKDVLYLITPDRFANGDTSNDTAEGANVNRANPGSRHGGDIQGIIDHMDYLKELGVTTLWLNPVQKNSANSYHGYAITDYYDIDPRFGTVEKYREFVAKAHSEGMKVVADMIFNHCGSSHWWMADLPTGDWLNFDNTFVETSHNKWTAVDPHAPASEKRLFSDGWFNRGMPDLNQKNPLVAKYLIQNCIWWIEYTGIDGVRQDTHPYMDPLFASRWCKETTEQYPDFNITGETWYPLGSGFPAWWQRGSALNPAFDSNLKSVMDFNLAFLLPDAFTDESRNDENHSKGLFNIYVSLANDFLYPDPDNVLVFLDNHDLGRFSRVEDKDLRRYRQAISFILTTRGIPQIYYGTELLFTGRKNEGDGVIRKDMPGGWKEDKESVFTPEGRTAQQNEAFEFMKKILHWRATSEAVQNGELIQYAPIPQYGDCYVYARHTADKTVLVILGGSDKDVDMKMDRYSDVIGDYTSGKDVISGKVLDIRGQVHVPARGVYILDLFKDESGKNLTVAPYAQFGEGLIDKIEPQGWLREILTRQRDGLTGHPEAMAYPYNSVLWAGELKRDSERRGADWWRFEQTAYYLDGLTRLGYILDDKELLDKWQQNIDYVLANPLPFKKGTPISEQPQLQWNRRTGGGPGGGNPGMGPQQGGGGRPQQQGGPQARPQQGGPQGGNFASQVSEDPRLRERQARQFARMQKQQKIASYDRPEGRLGPETGSMAWPFAVFFRAMKAHYEATGDPRIPEALRKNYLSYSVDELGMDRFVVNVEGILWTYALTGDPALRDLASRAWAEGGADMTQASALDTTAFRMHGVTMNELLKIPMILYSYTGDESYLEAALHAAKKMEGPNMLIDGINSSSEALAGNDPLASHETCDVSDYTWTMGYYLMTTGDGQWADRIEKGIFNAGLGSITKDFRSMQYFSCPNQVIATGNSNHNGFKHGLTWMAYRPIHETECCIGNLHRYMPNYVARMWLRDKNGNPVAALYGPSKVEYDLGDGITAVIEEKTQYPFEEKVDFVFTFMKEGKPTDKPVQMDFTYRIPGWCKSKENAGFHTVSKLWKSGDVLTVDLPMEVEVVDNPHCGKSIQRGPLVYSFAVPAKVEEDTAVYENLAGKVSANPLFKSWSMTPSGQWNWALVEGSLDDIKVEYTPSDAFPFDPGRSPLKLQVKAKAVPGWELQEGRYTPPLPSISEPLDTEETTIELVPYGSTTLRLTIFPTTK